MHFFRVIIPTYNRPDMLKNAIDSVKSQTFKDYVLVIPHDRSDKDEIVNDNGIIHVYHKSWDFNGGNRNRALEAVKDGIYTIFMDDDDIFYNDTAFQDLHDFIVQHNYPDLVRLPYKKLYVKSGSNSIKDYDGEDTLYKLARSYRVAPWTKCVKSELVVPFVEHTVFEDVVQHIAQVDNITTFTDYPYPFIEWRIHDGQTRKNTSLIWHSSRWKIIGELIDLDLKHDYAIRAKKFKIKHFVGALFDEYKENPDCFSDIVIPDDLRKKK